MSKILLVWLAVMAIVASTLGQQQCAENEEYTTCGSACEPSCAKPRTTFCTQQCIIGCQCKGGFLRSNQGACVPPGDC